MSTTGRKLNRSGVVCFLVGLYALSRLVDGDGPLGSVARAEDWPTYAHDVARSHVTSERLPLPLALCWAMKPRYAPQPAWGKPKLGPVEGIEELPRMHFDDTFHVAAADGGVYFGSSADNKVYCLDAITGRTRWTAITGGPVRLAPTVADGRVYVGSDDGWVYCLRAADGTPVWKFRAAPEDRRVLGSGRMISLWPLRTGVLVDNNVAYFGAGVFPAEGVFLYAVDAATGRELWRNDTSGETPQSRISPQGYLLASASLLYAPMGRVSPATFSRDDGRLQELTGFGKTVGGTYALLAEGRMFTGTNEIISYVAKNEKTPATDKNKGRYLILEARKVVVRGSRVFVATGDRLFAMEPETYSPVSRALQAVQSGSQRLQQSLIQARLRQRNATAEIADLADQLQEEQAKLAAAGNDEKAAMEARCKEIEAAAAVQEKLLAAAKADIAGLGPKIADIRPQIGAAREKLQKSNVWDIPCDCRHALILAGDVLFGGGEDLVTAVDSTSGKTLWTAKVDGAAKGLAVAAGRLLVSTDKGWIYSFQSSRHTPCAAAQTSGQASSVVADGTRSVPATMAATAETILQQTGVRRGYCLVWGCETGQLAIELAKRSELMIYAVSPDAAKVAAARRAIDAAGLYGARICVEQWPLDRVPYADYFANLIVSETALEGKRGQSPFVRSTLRAVPAKWDFPFLPAEMHRMLKPLGGVAWLGGPEKKVVRGPLHGAGNWTHLYGDAANTACGDDQLVKCPLSVLWFGEPGPHEMVSRHNRAASPLALDGRLFCQGENVVMAYDAYNGLQLWHRPIAGAMRTVVSHQGGNLAADRHGLFVALPKECLRLDPATGQTTATYAMPPLPKLKLRPGQAALRTSAAGSRVVPVEDRWGYLACAGELLYGSRTISVTQSDAVFALDIEGVKVAGTLRVPSAEAEKDAADGTRSVPATFQGGKPRWVHQGKAIGHNTIAISQGRLYLVDNNLPPETQSKLAAATREPAPKVVAGDRPADEKSFARRDVRTVFALDAQTGRVHWQKPLDVTFGTGGILAAMCYQNLLVLFDVYSDGHYWKEFLAGKFGSRRVTVVNGDDGSVLWSKPIGYRVRPILIGDTLHAEPWAFDVRTGEPKMRTHPLTGQSDRWQYARPGHHCGCPIASPNCLFFRSLCLGYYDLLGDYGTQHFGSQRPGCWINAIPAAGLLLMPEASVGCMCAFPNMCSVAFAPAKQNKAWAYYSAPGPTKPVERLALNFGAAGDRNDAQGKLWLGYPRPTGSLVLPLKVTVSFGPGGSHVTRNSSYTPIAGSEDPWLFASAARGITKCVIPLRDSTDGKAAYRVRLLMADPDNDRPGQRVFGIKLQGSLVQQACDIVKEAGGRDRALCKEFGPVEVSDDLLIEFLPGSPKPAMREAPILQGVEVLRVAPQLGSK